MDSRSLLSNKLDKKTAMDESFTLFSFMSLLFLSSMFPIPPTSAFSSTHLPLCHDDERSALLQLKESFIIDCDHASSDDPFAYPKVESWKLNGAASDCCSWDGVECDHLTGHVIGLDLSSSCLYGSINSSSSLFRLVHLRKLNLAFNHFNYSQIPPAVGLLSKLVYLNMSNSFLSGPIPSNVSDLSSLSSLVLSLNYQLSFQASDFRHLINNLTRRLEVLDLSGVDISSTVPTILANSSSPSLSYLSLKNCGLYGEFPVGIFHLPKLQILRLSYNDDLEGRLPEFQSSPLTFLNLAFTSFSGELPATIGNLNSLSVLVLMALDLKGEIPPSFTNLTQLSELYFSHNLLTGPLPLDLDSLAQLTLLDLSFNGLKGLIPQSISKLRNLENLYLDGNEFNGTVELGVFLPLRKLVHLDISGNNLYLLINTNSTRNRTTSIQKFSYLGFGSCNLRHFPDFLHGQDKLVGLALFGNEIGGIIPKWLWNVSTDTLESIDLSDNFLTGFESQPAVLPWNNLRLINFANNLLEGSLPLPPPVAESYQADYNSLSGGISPSFCNSSSLVQLSLNENNLSGTLPSCLGNFSADLQLLFLGRNNFHGAIPLAFPERCNLMAIALDRNQLGGQVPGSLANCMLLEHLSLGNNQISDVFPSWLGLLPNLKIVNLRLNKFYGEVVVQETKDTFQNLRVIDLSGNSFTGQLPAHYFLNSIALKAMDASELTYMGSELTVGLRQTLFYNFKLDYGFALNSKGTEQEYIQLLEYFAAIDLSSNRFEGDIPRVIGNLKGLLLLNLSRNNLTGSIPLSFANLTELESLDLSHNKLSGEIPQQLAQLTFLAVFNVSDNLLAGPIPRGNQFENFQNDSYQENPGLCGIPLSRKCGKSEAPPRLPPGLEDKDDSSSLLGFGWEPVAIGYASGLVFGLVIGYIVVTRHFEWFARVLRVRVKRTRRARNRRGRN